MTYNLYCTGKGGEGHVVLIGEYDDPTDIVIRLELYAHDVVFSIEEELSSSENDV